MKKERVRASENFLPLVRCCSMAILEKIATMNESADSFHTLETTQQSRQWLPKGQPGPVKAKVHSTRTKQMIPAFFDINVPRETTVNANYIMEALACS
jgi:hypothetical protein